MYTALTLGASRLHVLTVVPGRAGEAQRLTQALADLEPYCVAAEVDAAHALALRQRLAGARADAPFLARVAAEAVAARRPGDGEDVFVGAARYARDAEAPLIPILPSAKEPGFFERRRLRRLLDAVPPGRDEVEHAQRLEAALRSTDALGKARAASDLEAARRLADLLFKEDRTRVAVVLTAGRARRILDGLRALSPPPPRDWANEAPKPEVRKNEPYPPYR